MRVLLSVVLAPMPQPLKRWVMGGLLGARIDRAARIGWSIVDCDRLEMGPGSRIGHFTVLRGLRRACLDSEATIGNFNWITAARVFQSRNKGADSDGCFSLGRDSALTSRHYVDCSGGVTIGAFTTVAGVRSTILSHQIDVREGLQSTRSISIGDYCLVSSNVCLAPGASIPERSVIAMGAVVVGHLAEAGALYGGVPARVLRSNVATGKYFRRPQGPVGLTDMEHPDDLSDHSAGK